ncbi:MAG: histidine kinase [Halobacteriales archaeon SW_9_67_25]|jgi:CBS domain-containing protein|nr:MAG: histidine kinase [Halobacteriales archaeon SW_9_67_25]
MEDIFVGQLMSSPVQTVSPGTPIHEAAALMRTQDIGSLIVVGTDDHPEGILTKTDFVQLVADRASTDETLVEEYMNTVTETARANESLEDAADRMMENGIHHLPVVEDEAGVIGILTTTDLTAYLSPDWKPSPS